MIGIPLFGDQHRNIFQYVQAKISTVVDYQTITPESFTIAVKTVLTDSIYKLFSISTLYLQILDIEKFILKV